MNMVPREVVSSGARESNTFMIKASGKAFKVLIDGLYSDKIRAVVRELWSNAYDSHVEAGKADTPFSCKLPTLFDPIFSVRDYGVSMDHAGVMHLYTTVFESSKEGTNNTVGKLGLGSKSPFAYTDVFTVTAWKGGEKRLYSAYIGADYVPRIDFLGSEPSDEPQGMEIAFPVRSHDNDDFRAAADRVANGFDTLPECNLPIARSIADTLFEGPGWKLHRTTDWGHGAHARQGCVIYPIDPYAITGITELQREFLKAPVYIDFPIGELEISASRESLGYDAATCANIAARLAQIEQDALAHFETKFQAVKTPWESLLFYKEMSSLALPKVMLNLLSKLVYKGRRIDRTLVVPKPRLHQHGLSNYKVNYRRGANRLDPGGNYPIEVKVGEFRVYTVGKDEKVGQMEARILDDCRRRGSTDRIFVVRADPGTIRWARMVIAFGRMPTTEWIKLSDCPPPANGSVYARRPVKAKTFSETGVVQDSSVDLSSGGIYVPMERGEILRAPDVSITAEKVMKLRRALIVIGVLTEADIVYGIPATLKSAYTKRDSGWINLFSLSKEVVEANSDKLDAIGRLADLDTAFNEVRRSDTFKTLTTILRMLQLDKRPVFVPGRFGALFRVVARLFDERAALLTQDLAAYRQLFEVADVTLPCKLVTTTALIKAEQHMVGYYPMMGMLLKELRYWNINDEVASAVAEYVNLVDA